MSEWRIHLEISDECKQRERKQRALEKSLAFAVKIQDGFLQDRSRDEYSCCLETNA